MALINKLDAAMKAATMAILPGVMAIPRSLKII
jgi:hypothetical protein